MKNFFICIFSVLAVFFQLSVEGVLFPSRAVPDLALVLVITLVLTLGFKESIKWILLAGVLIDAGSGAVFGTATLAYFVIGWAISGLANVADIRSRKTFFLVVLAVLVVFSEIVKDIFFFFSLKIKGSYIHESVDTSLYIFSIDYFLKIFYTILAAYIVYYIFRRASRALFVEPVRLTRKVY